MRYQSRIDVWLLLLYAALATLPLLLDLLSTPGSVLVRPGAVLANCLALGLAWYFCCPCSDELEQASLLIRCGRRRGRIAYRDIVALARQGPAMTQPTLVAARP